MLPSQQTPGPDHLGRGYEVLDADAVEPKVKGAAVGATAGVIVTDFLVWGADELFWNGDAAPNVPFPVAGFIGLVVTVGLTFLGGFVARHVNRRVQQ